MARTLLLNKPYDVVTRFTLPANARPGQQCLADVVDVAGVYPVGRLDRDSEGALLLTSDKAIAARLLDPAYGHPRTYLAQVEGTPTEQALATLRDGIVLDGVPTRPAGARRLDPAPDLWARTPPIRHRLSVPTAWIELTLTEGRNRQVRRMTAAVGLPTLRLVRWAILDLDLGPLQPGDWRELEADELAQLRSSIGAGGAGRTRSDHRPGPREHHR